MGRKTIDRTNEEGYNNKGSLMRIINYKNSKDIDIYFPKYNWIIEHQQYNNFKIGNIKCPYDASVYGVGFIGEGDGIVSVDGKETKQYSHWSNMLERCYNSKYQQRQLTYIDCSVCEEWYNYQNFYEWFNENYYEIPGEKMHLDKDILIKDNKEYGPDTCIFAPQKINSLFKRDSRYKGGLPTGVDFNKKINKYVAHCGDNNGKLIHLGCFDNPIDAFNVYKEYKEELVKRVANEYRNLIPTELYDAMYNWEVDIFI